MITLAGISGLEITDAQKEREAIVALRDAESRVNHSVRFPIEYPNHSHILFPGIDHFLTCSSDYPFQKAFIQSNETLPKLVMIGFLLSQINFLPFFCVVYNLAEEYASSKDYEKALK